MSLRHTIHGLYKATAEAVLPARSQSAIAEKGVLTPDEFVQAGDYLVRTCPTWSWEAGEPSKAKGYLPKDKQYLVTRNVPCVKRTAAVDNAGTSEISVPGASLLEGDSDDWVAPQVQRTQSGRQALGTPNSPEYDGIVDIDAVHGPGEAPPADGATATATGKLEAQKSGAQGGANAGDSGSDVPDIDDLAIEDDEEDEAIAVVSAPTTTSAEATTSRGGTVRTRTYDLMITYDKYYQVPRIWLAGYDEHGTPLGTSQVFEDVTEEHARKTITVDPFPHTSMNVASIHPCRHANVMTKLGERLADSGKQLTCDNYLIIFLKFIASIVPNIEYDFTLAASL